MSVPTAAVVESEPLPEFTHFDGRYITIKLDDVLQRFEAPKTYKLYPIEPSSFGGFYFLLRVDTQGVPNQRFESRDEEKLRRVRVFLAKCLV